jgi:hypothetical protein
MYLNSSLRTVVAFVFGALVTAGCAPQSGTSNISSTDTSAIKDRGAQSSVANKKPEYSANGTYLPKMSDLMGANGSPDNVGGADLWNKMGLRFSRLEVGPVDGANLQDMVNRGWIADTATIDAKINYNNISGVSTLILLAYSPRYTSTIPNDTHSMPKDINAWQGYVEAVVKRYSAAPFYVKHFQIWNEAAGAIASSIQTPFWHGPAGANGVYTNAKEDYVNQVHIPAAKIIRRYGGLIVYGGWPCESSPNTYIDWLEYRSPSNAYNNMLDWIDYLDMHYYNVADLKGMYEKYSTYGQIKGIWQTEVGDAYMTDTNYIANYFFKFADFALDHSWSDPNKFVSMVYHYWGAEAYHLSFNYQLHSSGQSLLTLINNTKGRLSKFGYNVDYGVGAGGMALNVDENIVFQLIGSQGQRTITVQGIPAPRGFNVYYKDAVSDADLSSRVLSKSWNGTTLQITIDVPAGGPDLKGTYREKMGYVVVVPQGKGVIGGSLLSPVHSGLCLDISGASTANGAQLQQYACNGSGAQNFTLDPRGNGQYRIISNLSGKCIDLPSGSKSNGAIFQQWDCGEGNANQLFNVKVLAGGVKTFQSVASGKCLDVTGVSMAAGAKVQQWDCGNGGNQQFRQDFSTENIPLMNVKSGLCLDSPGNNNGDQLQQYSCSGGANQNLSFVPVGNNQYEIVVASTGKCLDITPAEVSKDGAIVKQWDCAGVVNQRFTFDDTPGGGSRLIRSVAGGKCLDLDSNTGLGGKLQIWTCNGQAQQQFQPRYTNVNLPLIAKHSGLCLDVAGASMSDGAKINQYPCGGGWNQGFVINPAGDGRYQIVNLQSKKCLEIPAGSVGVLGAQLQQSNCVPNASNQTWYIDDAGGDALALRSLANNNCIDIQGVALGANVPATTYTCSGGANQMFRRTR